MELLQDLKYGFRTLRRSPGFTLTATLTLAFGIAANTAIFSVVNRLLLSPPPFPSSDRLVTLWEHHLLRQRDRNVVSAGNFQAWREQAQSFEGMSAFADWSFNLTGIGEPEKIPAKVVSANLPALLGLEPAAGRLFRNDEDRPGSERVVMLSYGFWQRRFGGSPAIVGQALALDGGSRTVVGVLPAGFEFPGGSGDIWAPLFLESGLEAFNGRWLRVIGRLKPEVTVASAKSELISIADRLSRDHPEKNTGWSANLISLKETMVSNFEKQLLILLGAVGLLLLIACANVANLLLVRAAGREKEITVRTALGATRGQLLSQLLAESLCLATLAGITGLIGAFGAVKVLRQALPAELRIPGFNSLGIDARVVGFTMLVTLGSALLFGLLPALSASRPNLHEPLRSGGRHTAGGHRTRLRDVLVIGEVALALILLLGAGLLLRSFDQLGKVDPGFLTSSVAEVRLSLPDIQYSENPQQVAFYDQLEERLRALPGVEAAGAISFLPMSGERSASRFTVEGRPAPAPGQEPAGDMRAVTPGYFQAMGIPIVKGRALTAADRTDAPAVTVISETLARTMFPGEDPIGKHLAYDWDGLVSPEIVGIAGDVHHAGLATSPYMEIYRPLAQFPYSSMSVVVRARGDLAGIAALVRQEVHAIDPNLPVPSLTPMTELLAETLAQPRLNTLVLRLTLTGIAIGLVGAFLSAEVLSSLLFGIAPRDPFTFVGVPALLTIVGLAACVVPALRALKVDPARAMRSDG